MNPQMEAGGDDPLMNCRYTGWLDASLNLEEPPVAGLCACAGPSVCFPFQMCVSEHLVCVLGVVSVDVGPAVRRMSRKLRISHLFPFSQVRPGKGSRQIGVWMRLRLPDHF